VIHRYGRIAPDEDIVLVVTTSSHRQDTFAAAEFLMDYLKTRAPFWKRVERAALTAGVKSRAAIRPPNEGGGGRGVWLRPDVGSSHSPARSGCPGVIQCG
jgi:hypothetical protein